MLMTVDVNIGFLFSNIRSGNQECDHMRMDTGT